MKFIRILLIGVVTFMGSALLAQNSPKSVNFSKDEKVEKIVLTADQQQKIDEIRKETEVETQRIKEDKSIPNGNRGKLIRELHLKQNKRISEITNIQKP